jgi:hypothetical protein
VKTPLEKIKESHMEEKMMAANARGMVVKKPILRVFADAQDRGLAGVNRSHISGSSKKT